MEGQVSPGGWVHLVCSGHLGYLLTSPGKLLWAQRRGLVKVGVDGLAFLLGLNSLAALPRQSPELLGPPVFLGEVCLATLPGGSGGKHVLHRHW